MKLGVLGWIILLMLASTLTMTPVSAQCQEGQLPKYCIDGVPEKALECAKLRLEGCGNVAVSEPPFGTAPATFTQGQKEKAAEDLDRALEAQGARDRDRVFQDGQGVVVIER